MKRLIIIPLLFISLILSATTYYVSTSGDNGNTGLSEGQAWATLAYAEANATTAGSIIALKKGDTWAIDNVFDISHGGTAGSLITWDGSLWGTGANAIIQANSDGAASPKYYSLCHIAGCKYLTLQNITFDGNAKNRDGIVIGGDISRGPTTQNDERYITIQDCSVLNFGTGTYYCLGIYIQTWVNDIYNITIQRNIVDGVGAETISLYGGRSNLGATKRETHDCYIGYNTLTNMGRSGSLGVGVQVNNKITNTVIEHNTITTGANGTGYGLTIEANEPTAGWYPTGVIMRYNNVTNTTNSTTINSGCFFSQSGKAITAKIYYNLFVCTSTITVLPAVDISHSTWVGALFEFYNNTIINAGNYGFACASDTPGVVIFANNILYRNGGTDGGMFNIHLHSGQTVSAVTHYNNTYYRTSGTRWGYGDSVEKLVGNMAAWEPTAIVINPLFVANFTDFHLQSASPAKDAGLNVGLTEDYSGHSVPQGAGYDIGAYEYGTYKLTIGGKVLMSGGKVLTITH